VPAQRFREVWSLALPILGAMLSQVLLNLVDLAMVGHLGANALAGVGAASFLHFTAFSAITGLSSAVQAMAARRYGEGRLDETALSLNGGLLLSIAIGLPLSLVLIVAAPWLFSTLYADPAVGAEGTVYLQFRLAAIVAVGINFSFRGYWSAIRRARLYLYVLGGMSALNILLDWLLIFGKLGLPEMGTRGAGLANLISTFAGAGAYLLLAWREARPAGFMRRLPSMTQLGDLLRIGLPSCVQNLLFAGGFSVLLWIIGQIGTAELAVTNVLINITLASVLPGIAFGLAAAALTGSALGRGDVDDAYAWAWDVFRATWWVFAALAVPMLFATDAVLRVFFSDPATADVLVDVGRLPLRLIGLAVTLDGLGFILMNALLGVGASGAVALVAVGLQWGFFLPGAYAAVSLLGSSLSGIWILMTGYRAFQTGIFAWLWKQKRWAKIRV
ncbi:MATE family efflux transporter, partial [uncultured Nevskia sp.]|uniref:MATE family efflux transporter n=1 Tax=uncultured Nevskia sp. TaxID=228950 RepID=UPI0025FA02E5